MRSIGYRLHQSTKPLLMTLPITTNDCCLDFLFKIFSTTAFNLPFFQLDFFTHDAKNLSNLIVQKNPI